MHKPPEDQSCRGLSLIICSLAVLRRYFLWISRSYYSLWTLLVKYILCGQFIPFQYKRYKEGNLGLCQSTKNLRIFLAALREATKSIPTQPCFLDHDPNHRSLEIYEWHHDNWRNTIQYTYIYIIYTRLLNLFEANTTELMIYIHFLDACKARDPRRTVAWSFTRLVIQVHVAKLWFFQSPTIVQYYKCLSLVASAEISSI